MKKKGIFFATIKDFKSGNKIKKIKKMVSSRYTQKTLAILQGSFLNIFLRSKLRSNNNSFDVYTIYCV